MDTPFTCAATIGDMTFRITNGILTSLEMRNDRIHYPEAIFHVYVPPHTGNIIMEPTKTVIGISNKLVKDCSIEELLFAIQKKLDK